MRARYAIAAGLVGLSLAGTAFGQAASQTERVKGEPKVETVKKTGEVVWTEGNWLVARMQPIGNYSLFNVPPGQEFMIDAVAKHVDELTPGTVLTGMITPKTTPVTTRTTTTTLEGTVLWALRNFVVLRLE